MKKVLQFWSSKHHRPFSEKEVRAQLGEKDFNTMVQEATEAMKQEGEFEYYFPYGSPYYGWNIEDKTGRRKHTIGVSVFSLLVSITMFVVGLQCIPPRWVDITFTCIAGGVGLVGGVLKLKAINDTNCWLRDIANPLLIGGLVMVMSLNF